MATLAYSMAASDHKVESFVNGLLDHYPAARLLDIYKSSFQDYMGAEHLVNDTASARAYLEQELASTSLDDLMPWYYEPCGVDSCHVRVSLRAVMEGLVSADLLLDAFTRLHTELRNAGFFLDIYGPRRYDYDLIEHEIITRDLSDVVAIHNEVSGEEKERVLLEADVFLMASRFEGHPMGLIEALAYGLPCMVTPGTNMSEEIGSADAGWTCEGTIEDISKTLIQIISEKELYARKGNNGRELSLAYNWPVLAEKFHHSLLVNVLS